MKEKINVFELNNEDEARERLEKIRWPDGPICPHCGLIGDSYRLNGKAGSKKPVRKGVWKCKGCRKQFTVMVGTIFSGSHIPLHKWLMAIYLLCTSKKGMSAHQMHRMLGITYKSAWFLVHRIRYAMSQPPLSNKMKGIIEADETYVGGKGKGKRGRGAEKKEIVFTLVERDGRIKSTHVANVTATNLKGVMREHVDQNSTIMTDEFRSYKGLDKEFENHYTVAHGEKEYVRGIVHTNTAEGYFSLLKRGINGSYHHVSKQHLPFYINEFDFRYNFKNVNDSERTVEAIKGFEGKRLFYRTPTE